MATKLVTKTVSTKGSVNWKDFLRSLAVAAGAAAITVLAKSLESGQFPGIEELKLAGTYAAAAGLSYIGKQFLSGPEPEDHALN